MSPVIHGLYVYPVKSCRGIQIERVELTERGLLHDREWMIVESQGHPSRFVTQREIPKLALIETALHDDALLLQAPGMGEIHVESDANGSLRDVVVWRDTLPAVDQGDRIADWLSDFVSTDVRLVRFDPRNRRPCNPQFAGDSAAHTQFADGYPLLVIGRRSLDDLNHRLRNKGVTELPMNRFRPNLVIDGLEAYDEDHIRELKFDGVKLRLVKPCTRCQITTTNQNTAEVGDEPLRTLAGYRNNSGLGGVTFGVNAVVAGGVGTRLVVGTAVEVDWTF